MSDTTITLYTRDKQLWKTAREYGGPHGLSSLVERAVRQYLDHQEPPSGDALKKFVLPVTHAGGENVEQNIEFQGRLLIDSEGFSVEQLPRVRVYRTTAGRFVVYRTWPPHFDLASSYSIYPDLEGLEADPQALDTMWITEHDMRGEQEHPDLTSDILRELRKTVRRDTNVSIDHAEIEPRQVVRLKRDDDCIRRRFQDDQRSDEDALIIAMHFLRATEKDPESLSKICDAWSRIKPLSKFGNTPDDLKDLQAAMRGYLNNDKRKRSSMERLFVNSRRGFWGLSRIGDRRAIDVAHQLGFDRD